MSKNGKRLSFAGLMSFILVLTRTLATGSEQVPVINPNLPPNLKKGPAITVYSTGEVDQKLQAAATAAATAATSAASVAGSAAEKAAKAYADGIKADVLRAMNGIVQNNLPAEVVKELQAQAKKELKEELRRELREELRREIATELLKDKEFLKQVRGSD